MASWGDARNVCHRVCVRCCGTTLMGDGYSLRCAHPEQPACCLPEVVEQCRRGERDPDTVTTAWAGVMMQVPLPGAESAESSGG